MLKKWKMPLGELGTNCYLAWDSGTLDAVVIDPGAEAEKIFAAIEERKLTPVAILNTHGHGDHIGANGEVKKKYAIPLYINEADAGMLDDAELNVSGLFGEPVTSPAQDGFLSHGDTFEFGNCKFKVLSTPGHTPGGISLYDGERHVFTGDALFYGSVGRCDLPDSDMELQLSSIRENLFTLPDDTIVLPGHGRNTTIGEEKQWNPYLK